MKVREFLFRGFNGCTDHNCLLKGMQQGVGTNGGCKCILRLTRGQLTILSSRLSTIAENESGVKQLRQGVK